MNRETFADDCGLVPFVELGDRLFFPDEMELFYGDGTIVFDGWDEAFAYVDGGFSFADEVDAIGESVLVPFNGGGGSSSSSSSNQEFKFDHASGSGRDDRGTVRFPAEFNDGEKSQSLMKTLDKFRAKHSSADHEYGITVDEQGFVHKYHEGGSTSVAISGTKGQMIIHNHPSGGNFSDSDLIHTSQTQERGIIASGSKGDYIFEKGAHFDAKGFVRAVRTARMTGKDYDDATHKWLAANQDKYGYRYRFRKAK